MLLVIAGLLVGIILLVPWLHGSIKKDLKKEGLPGFVKYNDLSGTKKTFIDERLNMVSKPDLVAGDMVREVKSGIAGATPFYSDMLQVGAEMMATKTSTAELQYKNKNFRIELNDVLKNEVESVINKMRSSLLKRISPKATPSKKKCLVCDLKGECTEAVRG